MLLKDKVAVVTGATRGIGKAILYRFAEEGTRLIGLYQNSVQAANEIQEDFNKQGLYIEFFKGSVMDQEFISRVFMQVRNTHGKIDILINNAGVVRDNFLFQMPIEDWDLVYRTNFLGSYICSTAVLPYMEEQGGGKIINIVSLTGVFGREAQINYGTSKGSVIGLTRLLSRDYAKKGININAIAPGMIETEMIHHVPQEKVDHLLHYTHLERLGKPKEVAETALFLSSHLSDYISGIVLDVDGGFIR